MNCYEDLSIEELKFRYKMNSLHLTKDELIGLLFDRIANPRYDIEKIKDEIDSLINFNKQLNQTKYSVCRITNELKEILKIESTN